MIDSKTFEHENEAWLPSPDQPEPTNLGEFLQLLGQSFGKRRSVSDYHLTTSIRIKEVINEELDTALLLIENGMEFSEEVWTGEGRGGKLSKYGLWPRIWKEAEYVHAIAQLRNHAEADNSLLSILLMIASLQAQLVEEREFRKQEEILLEARRIFCLMWFESKEAGVDKGWIKGRRTLNGNCSELLCQTLLLLASMICCHVPLSAAAWVHERFIPVRVDYQGQEPLLGLLSKHAATPNITSG